MKNLRLVKEMWEQGTPRFKVGVIFYLAALNLCIWANIYFYWNK